MKDWLNFLNANNGISILIASVSALISAIAVGFSLFFNARTQYQYKKSLEPQLSMRMDNYNGILYLSIQNTGRTVAKKININVNSIENNGTNGLVLDALFSQTFELYPNETVQAMVAISGENISTGTLYPMLSVDVNYYIMGKRKMVKYSRTIIFSKVYDSKLLAEVNMDLANIESSLKSAARAIVRTANYLDGHQTTVFDQLNILAGKSLLNDLCSILEMPNKEPIKNRIETIESCKGLSRSDSEVDKNQID